MRREALSLDFRRHASCFMPPTPSLKLYKTVEMFKNFIARQFKKPSGWFGNFSSRIMIRGNRNKYETIIKDMDIQPNDKLLEIGYGPGIGIHMIADLCESCTIHGIDFSKLMYKKASNYNKSNIDKGKVQLQYGDYLNLSATENQYDKIFCLNVIYFWDELNKPLEITKTQLKINGAFYIFMFDVNVLIKKKAPDSVFNKYSIDQVVGSLKSAGFSEVEHYFKHGHYIKAKK
jgi:ubiquinone/menaquinone biosynthesis C-methylase UbiE